MGDINFLSGQKGDKKGKKKEPLKKVEWTSPEAAAKPENKKEENSPFFSLFKKSDPADDKIRQSREAVLKTIGEKEEFQNNYHVSTPNNIKEIKKPVIVPEKKKVEENKEPEPKNIVIQKPKLPRPAKKTEMEPRAVKPEPIRAEVKTPAREKDIDPRRINFLNRLIDSWRNRAKDKQEKKDKIELIPDLQKKEEKTPMGEGKKIEKKEEKPKNEKDNKNPDGKVLIDSHVLETNLVKGENVLRFIDWQKHSVILALFGSFAVFIVAGAYFWLIMSGREVETRIVNIDKNIVSLNDDIDKIKNDIQQFSVLEKKVKLLDQLLDNHIYWTNFFKFLEDNTLEDIFYLDGFSGDDSGSYKFAANATNFNSISEQLKVFKRNDFVRSVSTEGGELNSEVENATGVNFDLQISVDPKLFNFPK